MKIMSFNVKHIPFEDFFFIWKKRYKKLINLIKRENPDILGMQEITKSGKKYIEKKLTQYNVIGDSRHSAFLTDEYNPVLIKKEYNIKSSKTYSLSENINKLGTKTKDDNYPRICVVVHINKNSDNFLIVNTHIDNSSFENKNRLLEILKKIIKDEKKDNEFIIMLGDYNMTMGNVNLYNFSKEYVSPFKDYKEGTFPSSLNLRALDHIFLDKRLNYSKDKIHKDSNDRGFLSDHNPISCIVTLKK